MNAVAIIGAGIAGISAAALLHKAGWQVTLIDKAGKPGGRCATRRVSPAKSSAWFDYGAQYITARDPAFRAVVDADLATGHLIRWSPTIAVAERHGTGWTLSPSPDTRERFAAPAGLNHWARHRLDQAGGTVACDTRAIGIRHRNGQWHIDCLDGHTGHISHAADALVLTIPAAQAGTLLGEHARGIEALTHSADALAACHSWVVEAPALDCQGIFVKGGNLAWCADNSHKAGHRNSARRLWTLHAGPKFSQAHIETSSADVQRHLVSEFAAISGIRPRDIKPVHGHRWRYARPGDDPPPTDTGCVVTDARLALAGDWLAGGRVEGAWLSGRQAATRIIQG